MTSREILDVLSRLEGEITAAYLADVLGIKSAASIAELERAIAAQDAEGVMQAAGFRPDSWGELESAFATAYAKGGRLYVNGNVPARYGMSFNSRNPRAEAWVRNHSSQLVTYISTEQREAIREALEAGLQAGRNPRHVALDIVGRVNQATGRREGGIIGLNRPQAQAAMSARAELENLSKHYFTRQRRDRRFDRIVLNAINTGKPLMQTDINRIVERYEARLLALRGETVGRTEALTALNSAADESLRQVVEQGLAPPEAIKRIMDATGDSRTREAHRAWDGQERGLDEPFRSGTGAELMYPGDTSLGAGPEDTATCRCLVKHRISFVDVELAR